MSCPESHKSLTAFGVQATKGVAGVIEAGYEQAGGGLYPSQYTKLSNFT